MTEDALGTSPRGPWGAVPDGDWCDWRWQQQHRLRSLEEVAAVTDLTDEERRAFSSCGERFRVAITPYYAALMLADPSGAIRRQCVPSPEELQASPYDLEDPLGEERHMPVPGVTHRYPDRALLYVTHHCPVYCRHCTRKRKVSDPGTMTSRGELQVALDYLRAHTEIRDVLVSGGDPLTLSDGRLVELCRALRAIPHLEIIRLCTRNPVTLPFRITDALLRALQPLHPILVHTHFNHPAECSPEAARCLRALADHGFSTANQMVLLKGVNDDADVVREVNHWLLRQRCRPYYLFQADLAQGISHFRTPIDTGLGIIEALRGHTSGMAVPHFVVDAPGGGGKVAMVPDCGLERGEGAIRFRNYLGETYGYPDDG